MQQMINGYIESSVKVKARIDELRQLRSRLREEGREPEIISLDLERRIHLLYVENGQLEETIKILTSCKRRIDSRGKT